MRAQQNNNRLVGTFRESNQYRPMFKKPPRPVEPVYMDEEEEETENVPTVNSAKKKVGGRRSKRQSKRKRRTRRR